QEMIRGNVFFEVEKIEQLALINRLTTHHDLRPSLKASDDGIMIRQYSRRLFQQHRSNSALPRYSRNVRSHHERTSARHDRRSQECHLRKSPRALKLGGIGSTARAAGALS